MTANDRVDIASVIGSMGILVDTRRWEELVSSFAPVVRVHDTSLFGGAIEVKPAQALVASWADFLPRFTGTHLNGTPSTRSMAIRRLRRRR
jgi:hypothetical protein